MVAIERAHFDRIARLASFEVVADVFLAADGRVRMSPGNVQPFSSACDMKQALPAPRLLTQGHVLSLMPVVPIVGDGTMRIGRSGVVIGRCHRHRGAQLRRTPDRQTVAHHRSEAEARGKDPAVVDAQVRVDKGEQVVEEDAVSVEIPWKVADPPGATKMAGSFAGSLRE